MKAPKKLLTAISLLMLSALAKSQTNTFPASGDVGIGTTSPTAKLHISTSNGVITQTAAGGNGKVNIFGYYDNTYGSLIEAVDNSSIPVNLSYRAANHLFYTGNVGIGTTSPIYKLQVSGTIKGNGFLADNSNDIYGVIIHPSPNVQDVNTGGWARSFRIVNKSADDNFALANFGALGVNAEVTYAYINVASEQGSHADLKYDLNSGLRVYPDKVYVADKIGIGTLNPTEKLSVNGNISAKKIIVTQADWPDYVFHPSYKLISLAEVAQFINNNQHLPDIPSVKEVKEKGVNLGDNQVLLLKKIEELTLYLIQQDKKITALEEELHNR